MYRISPIWSAVAVVLLTGAVHGLWTQRWRPSEGLAAAVARLDDVPLTVGDWQGKPEEIDPELVRSAGLSGYWMRRYTNVKTGGGVTVLLMCGKPGPVSVHTPNHCYQAAGFEMTAPPAATTVATAGGEPLGRFWTTRFRKEDSVLPTQLRVWWAWKGAGGWEAPPYPRWTFAGLPALYKLYVIRDLGQSPEPREEGPCMELMRQLLPVLEEALSPSRAS